ncbi:TPA: signal recognition particle-docking protein FtsY [Pasteurella multocida]|uniref:signal recognition particle-docking protein FtsY n=1 Tax=Pasteurella multocida TaxID=747 RepID=UPI0007ED09C9|nr:signal recognition particle-docking protein FtsY [Pasteurella multocida]MCL7788818.1 signal recognition particle-docking protein FtsY [Pasteurella multocida]MDY0643906.1 signal recognition particle-docking protein FtsY [Pasteurella multocida]MEE3749145.1 signal recognition particle-docking protein FtsY [Pasteurella multocida]OBP27080.1 signal recognition particle-docking protein FtsY [Pasteurella multocida subsp. multocida]PNM06887.1 signal recognition particle-docking protein FtsY [Pasteur
MSTENKKGGFWSWLGLGKKQETPEATQTLPSTETSDNIEQVEEIKSEVEPQIEQTESAVISDEISSSTTSDTPATFSPTLDKTDAQHVKTDEGDDVQSAFQQAEEETKTEDCLEETDSVASALTSDEDVKLAAPAPSQPQEQEKKSEGGFFSRLVKGLLKTKQNLGAGFRSFFFGKKIDDALFEELEEQLLIADLGVPTATKIINNLTQHASHQQLKEADLLYQQLKVEMAEILKPVAQPLVIDQSKKPYVILMVGVNGVGKTTTIGKLARQFQNEGKSVMLAAGDTFRAAAVEQLQVWGERNGIPVVAQSTGSDSASVIFDAMQSAAARHVDVLIADTAGRLQNKNNLMDELKKIVRVMKKYDETAPHEIMLTLDAGTGQNAISQAKLFHEAVGLTGITLTKLDGTAKGGVIFAIADQFNLPIRYIGVGEKIEDLRPFNADEFIDALFVHEDESSVAN